MRSPLAVHTVVAQDQPAQVRILRGFNNNLGQSCRVVEQTVIINSQRVRATGTVCQQSDGNWAITR